MDGCKEWSESRTSQRDYSLSSEELHAEQSEDHDEQEEEEEQADDGLHGVQEGDHEIPQRVPVSVRKHTGKTKKEIQTKTETSETEGEQMAI